eukprot:2419904-Rhodomonas_salina.2
MSSMRFRYSSGSALFSCRSVATCAQQPKMPPPQHITQKHKSAAAFQNACHEKTGEQGCQHRKQRHRAVSMLR